MMGESEKVNRNRNVRCQQRKLRTLWELSLSRPARSFEVGAMLPSRPRRRERTREREEVSDEMGSFCSVLRCSRSRRSSAQRGTMYEGSLKSEGEVAKVEKKGKRRRSARAKAEKWTRVRGREEHSARVSLLESAFLAEKISPKGVQE